MKKLLFLLTAVFVAGALSAQNIPCNVVIRSDFDSECIITEYPPKDDPDGIIPHYGLDFNQGCLKACRKNHVSYYAECAHAVSYTWTVTGADSYTVGNNGQAIQVLWGNAGSGSVSVTVLTSNGNSCSASVCIGLLNPPTVASTTIPHYFWEGEDKVIEVCVGESITLIDESSSGNAITGYFWHISGHNTDITASTPTFVFNPEHPGQYYIKHMVQNECGCQAAEMYFLRVLEGKANLKLSCHGMVCRGSTQTYKVYEPHCDTYYWHVEGGVIESGQYTPEITVQWDNPAKGYGIIALDQKYCKGKCNSLQAVKIPVLMEGAAITGNTKLCVGEVQLYELPLWGSTEYTWNIEPSNGAVVMNYHYDNQRLLKFTIPGTYHLNVTYACEFIDCGPFNSIQREITVKPVLSIASSFTGENICQGGNPVTFTANPAMDVGWSINRVSGGSVAFGYGTSITHTFSEFGEFIVRATRDDYFCNTAEYRIRVHPKPSTPVVTGSRIACAGDGIELNAVVVDPDFRIHWAPACASLTVGEGPRYSRQMPLGGCQVYVYHESNAGCRSDSTLISLEEFVLIQPPQNLTAYTYSTLVIDNLYQPNVRYRWSVIPANSATITGDHTAPTASIYFNYVEGTSYPATVRVRLERVYCNNLTVTTDIMVTVHHVPLPTIVANPNPACANQEVTITATGTLPGSTCRWEINGTAYSGAVIHPVVFPTTGTHTITLYYTPNTGIEEIIITRTINVSDLPGDIVQAYTPSGVLLRLPVYDNVEYRWYRQDFPDDTLGDEHYYIISSPPPALTVYCCEITLPSGCIITKCVTVDGNTGGCLPIVDFLQQPECNTYLAFVPGHLTEYQALFHWTITPSSGVTLSPVIGNTTTATFREVGYYTIKGMTDNFCVLGRISITYAPKFTITHNPCTNILTIIDQTLNYGDAPAYHHYNIAIPGISWSTSEPVPPGETRTIPSLPDLSSPQTLSVTLTGECYEVKTITVTPKPRIENANISVPAEVCSGTPFQVSVSGEMIQYRWNFGDGSNAMGNAPYHTYEYPLAQRDIYVIGTHSSGCLDTSQLHQIIVNPNPLDLIELTNTQGTLGSNCYGQTTPLPTLGLNVDNPSYDYYWSPPNGVTGAPGIYYPNRTGYYSVRISNADGCVKELQASVYFKDTPRARISGKTMYCEGDSVKLFGGAEIHNNIWRVFDSNGGTYISVTTPNLSIKPPAGTYTVTLNVTNEVGCFASDVITVAVHPNPQAPDLYFPGDACIYHSPVRIADHNNTNYRPLHWSNGNYGWLATYYSSGWATAYHKDPTTGCRSEKDSIFILPPPNFDALLTGCYKTCKKIAHTQLGLYRFAPNISNYSWNWIYNTATVQSGNNTVTDLGLHGFGTYQLDITYDACPQISSPYLELQQEEPCPCEKIIILPYKIWCDTDNCKLMIYFHLEIHNYGGNSFSVDEFWTSSGQVIEYWNHITVHPWNYEDFIFGISIHDFSANWAEFTIFDHKHNCKKTFTFPLDWRKCVECEEEFKDFYIDFRRDISTLHEASFFKFSASFFDNTNEVYSMWSEPPMIMDYLYNPYSADGLVLLYYGIISQLAVDPKGEVCFYALACVDGRELCLLEHCVKAIDLLNMILQDPPSYSIAHIIPEEEDESPPILSGDSKLYLHPNPTRDLVTVTGTDPASIKEVAVFTMELKQVATFKNTHQFNISNFAPGMYIVRVITQNGQVDYLKLVKQ